MKKFHTHFYIVFIFILIISCAKRGTITGGDKDILPPKITSASPENFSKNFSKNIIKIYFDEYIKVKDLQKQLIVSPPMKTQLTVLPQGMASKYISIKINDTLKPNTTYSFNFGQSIVDNNEGNPYQQLKYVFSTGAYIDSLSVEGVLKDSYEKKTDNFVNVMLYEVDEKFNDSTIYKETPRYVTNTLDSLNNFKLENIKAGKYHLVALKQKSNNYLFNPKKDKIGFYNQTITVPDKSIFELELFKENINFKTKKPVQTSGNRMIIGYEGNAKNTKVSILENSKKLVSRTTKFAEKDSLQIWFMPLKTDSVAVNIENLDYKKDYFVKVKNQKKDTLKITNSQNGSLDLSESFKINSSIPLNKFDFSKFIFTEKDSSKVDFKTNYDDYNQTLEINFDKESNQKYKLLILPNAVEDYLGQKNDSITFYFSTKATSDYGNLKLTLQNAKSYPVIVELTDEKGAILAYKNSVEKPVVEFLLLEPKKYYVRLIYDKNKNQIRDTGNYLKKIQPEETIHFPKEIDIRANWDVDQAFDLSLKPVEKVIKKKPKAKEPVK